MITFSEASDGHENEDALKIERFEDGWIGAIADGQGGCFGGGRAARLACEKIVNLARETATEMLVVPGTWTKLFEATDREVSGDSEAGITSVVAFCVKNGRVYGAACGDTAAYLCNVKIDVIELTANQQKNPQIGSGKTSCTFFTSVLVKPWSLLFMTDGVWKYVGRERITDLLKRASGKELGTELESSGRLPGSEKFPDDFTYALIES